MHWMSVKLPDNFQMREHSWPCRFHIILGIEDLHVSVGFPPYICTYIYNILKLTRYYLLYFDSQYNSQIFQELSPLQLMEVQYHKSLKCF